MKDILDSLSSAVKALSAKDQKIFSEDFQNTIRTIDVNKYMKTSPGEGATMINVKFNSNGMFREALEKMSVESKDWQPFVSGFLQGQDCHN